MPFRIGFIFLISLFCIFVEAKECSLEAALRDPKIANNAQFWEDYSRLDSTQDSEAISVLLRKYGHQDFESANAGIVNQPPRKSLALQVDRKAEKEISLLPTNLKGKVDEFVSAMIKPGGVAEVRNNPGRYHLEKLSQFGDHAYSIRLNDGYRVLFDMTESDIKIRRVNKGQIHGN